MTEYLKRHISSEIEVIAPVYDELTVWSSRFGLLMLDNLEVRAGVTGLDLGCATGFPLIELAMLHGPSSHFTGVDVWQGALDMARKKIEHHRLPNIDLKLVNAADLPFFDGSFDLVTSNLGINNFDDPEGAVREAFRVSRPGGRIVLTTNPTGTLPEVYDVIREVLADVSPDSIARIDEQERHRGTIESAQALLTDAGFQLARTIPAQFTMTFADGTALLNHGLCAYFLEGWQAALPAEHEQEIFTAVEAVLNDRASAVGCLATSFEMVYLEAERPG